MPTAPTTPSAQAVPATTSATSVAPADTTELSVSPDEENKYPKLAGQRAKSLAGDANEQFILAGMYERGEGAPRSYAEAAKWYRLAAEQGHAAAQFYLGAMYGSSRGVERSFKAAVWWYSKSAAQGYRDAFYPMAFAHEYGIGVGKDEKVAIQWYEKSAGAGVWQAHERLGKAYLNGELGLFPDAEKAKVWSAQAETLKGSATSINVGK